MATLANATLEDLAQRLQTVESGLAEIRSIVNAGGADVPWYLRSAGKFEDDPEFDEVVELGRKCRHSNGAQSR